MTGKTQPGGASTISGVLYQILWTLLRALRVRIQAECATNDDTEALFVLEPSGGGGDLRLEGKSIEVEQLKAKSDGGTWPLRTIIEDVLPDLFLAVGRDARPCRFRFVTEGRMGRWESVYDFF